MKIALPVVLISLLLLTLGGSISHAGKQNVKRPARAAFGAVLYPGTVMATKEEPKKKKEGPLEPGVKDPGKKKPPKTIGALRVTTVYPGTPAQVATLQRGDLILAVDGVSFPNASVATQMAASLPGNRKPGSVVALTLLRKGKELTLKVTLTPAAALPTNKAIDSKRLSRKIVHERVVSKVIRNLKLKSDYEALVKTFALRDELGYDPFMSHQFLFAHREPLKAPDLARTLTDAISTNYSGNLPLNGALHASAQLIGSGHRSKTPKRLKHLARNEAHLKQLVALVEKAAAEVRTSLKKIPKERLDAANKAMSDAAKNPGDHANGLTSVIADQAYLVVEIDRTAMMYAAERLAVIDDPRYLKGLGRAHLERLRPDKPITEPGVTGEVLYVQDTKAGRLIVGGPGDNVYTTDAAIILDIGGNDLYKNRPGSSAPGRPVGLCIDLDGDDRYETTEPFAQGCGLLGVGMLIDVAGNDTYIAKQAAQGCGLIGVGILVDKAGKDQYKLGLFGQGAGGYGLGLLVDASGPDQYKAALLSQAFAMTGGAGVLLDVSGNDTYHATGVYPSAYPDDPAGTFSSNSQGYATGVRPYYSGGVAALIDSRGDDQYNAGNFSQAGGYWYALGMIRDRVGNDIYTGTRYSQAFGVHMGVGILLDNAGNDQYNCKRTANQGSGWDAGSGFFIDTKGNDTYVTDGNLHQGGAAQNGFALFVDEQGTDRYQGNPPGAGQPHNAAYGPPGFSLGIFIDAGGGKDKYTKSQPNNDFVFDQDPNKYGIFIDSKYPLERVGNLKHPRSKK